MNHITIETTIATEDKTGRDYLIFTPIFKVSLCGRGEIRLPIYHAFIDEPHTISEQKQKAMETAKESLAFIFQNFKIAA